MYFVGIIQKMYFVEYVFRRICFSLNMYYRKIPCLNTDLDIIRVRVRKALERHPRGGGSGGPERPQVRLGFGLIECQIFEECSSSNILQNYIFDENIPPTKYLTKTIPDITKLTLAYLLSTHFLIYITKIEKATCSAHL